jgi:hypothetical protein
MVVSGVAVPHVVMSHVAMGNMARGIASVLPTTRRLMRMIIHLVARTAPEELRRRNALEWRPLQPMVISFDIGRNQSDVDGWRLLIPHDRTNESKETPDAAAHRPRLKTKALPLMSYSMSGLRILRGRRGDGREGDLGHDRRRLHELTTLDVNAAFTKGLRLVGLG